MGYANAKDDTKIKHPTREGLQILLKGMWHIPFLAGPASSKGLVHFVPLHILHSCISPHILPETHVLPTATKSQDHLGLVSTLCYSEFQAKQSLKRFLCPPEMLSTQSSSRTCP